MREKNIFKKTILSEDRISVLILASLFCVCMTFSGCGKAIVMHKADENAKMEPGILTINTVEALDEGEAIAETHEIDAPKTAGAHDMRTITDDSVNVYKVHVCGAVNEPGVYEVKAGDRVIDAVTIAGGLREDACGDAVNLASQLQDCSRIYIPTLEEVEGDNKGVYAAWDISSLVNDTEGNATRKVNINTASEAELQTITGIGVTRAKSIISYRQNNGAFKRIEDIMNVSGIGNASFEKMKDKITVD